MNTKILLLLSLCLLISCSDNSNSKSDAEQKEDGPEIVQPDVIYGDDGRGDLYQITNFALLALADSTVALIDKKDFLGGTNGTLSVTGDTLGQSQQLCSTEPFRDQVAAAFCSGFLVANDTIVTAGHCITNETDCANVKFVFGYALKTFGGKYTQFSAADVVGCKSVVHTQSPSAGADFAVVKLDRVITNHAPLKIRVSGKINLNDPLIVIGHPSGLPTKIAGGANVRENSSLGFFVSNLDTYGGNSGSAVFNANTLEVEGVLVRGENDYVMNGSCRVSNRCALDMCRGEDVTRITEVLPYVFGVQPPPPPPTNETVYSANPKLIIPDNKLQGVSSTIDVPDLPAGRKVLVRINVSHTWIGDLYITLKNPDGKTLVLRNKSGGSADNIIGTFGEDIPTVDALTSLSATSRKGKWTITVSDRATSDTGVLNEWAVVFKN